ncbi:MAG: DNA polymerase III subunit gamma/tau [bacterium]|nr:DNA polymerase III subunit gamma/tau [bacterium]
MALYHKHRPQNFSEMIGQDHIVKTLTNQIKGDRIAHAYLFSGGRGIGKTTAARLMAKAINCQNMKSGSIEPCNKCQICSEISKSSSIDVLEIDAASHTGVDNVRENIIENAQFRPTKSKYKVFIIDEAHMLSTPAFNALLKTLEEPPEYVIFILATTEYHRLPATIVSRCQRFNFKKVPFETMKKHLENIAKLEKIRIDKEVIERIINKSEGCVRDAISLLDQIMASGESHITSEIASVVLPTSNIDEIIEFLEMLLEHNTPSALLKVNKLAEEGVDMSQFIYDIIEILRVMLISQSQAKLTSVGSDLSKEAEKKMLKLNKKVSSADIIKLIDLLIKRRSEIKMHTITQLPLELVVVEWSAVETKGSDDDQGDSSAPTKKEEEKKDIPEEKEKKSIKDRVKEMVHKDNTITLEVVKEKWNDFMSQIERESTSLAFILKTSTLKEMIDNTLNIAVNYSIHQDKLMSAECRKNIEKILATVYNTKIRIDVSLDHSDGATKNNADNELQDLAAAFGGEVVN